MNRQVWVLVVSRKNSSWTANEVHPVATLRSFTKSEPLASQRPTTHSYKEITWSGGFIKWLAKKSHDQVGLSKWLAKRSHDQVGFSKEITWSGGIIMWLIKRSYDYHVICTFPLKKANSIFSQWECSPNVRQHPESSSHGVKEKLSESTGEIFHTSPDVSCTMAVLVSGLLYTQRIGPGATIEQLHKYKKQKTNWKWGWYNIEISQPFLSAHCIILEDSPLSYLDRFTLFLHTQRELDYTFLACSPFLSPFSIHSHTQETPLSPPNKLPQGVETTPHFINTEQERWGDIIKHNINRRLILYMVSPVNFLKENIQTCGLKRLPGDSNQLRRWGRRHKHFLGCVVFLAFR